MLQEGGDVFDVGKNIDVSKEEFKKILLLDGCFIIELLRTKYEQDEQVRTIDEELRTIDEELRTRMKAQQLLFSNANYQVIYHDLLLLDNEIPWFVLQLLFDRTNDYLECTNFTLVDNLI
ncbi:hypothetical protein SLE2022_323320 [Rubroshorea leprosula]